MNESLAEEIITSILNYRRVGIEDDEELIERLQKQYANLSIDFELFLELMNTGAFRASFVMIHGKYPLSNLDNDIVVNTSFKIYWIGQKGIADYNQRFAKPKRKWWHFK